MQSVDDAGCRTTYSLVRHLVRDCVCPHIIYPLSIQIFFISFYTDSLFVQFQPRIVICSLAKQIFLSPSYLDFSEHFLSKLLICSLSAQNFCLSTDNLFVPFLFRLVSQLSVQIFCFYTSCLNLLSLYILLRTVVYTIMPKLTVNILSKYIS